MKLVLQTAAADVPVPIVTAAEHLRVVDEDDYPTILRLIGAATERLQKRHWTQFVSATFDEYFDGFADELPLRINPVVSVASVKYTDMDGVAQTVGTSVWELGSVHGRAAIRLAYGQSWPSGLRGHADTVVVRYVAGYGTQAAIPQAIVDAILIEVGDLYLIRDPVVPERMRRLDRLADNLMAGYSYRTTGRA
jgi:uncharacterized phiE125 gp8 family phage protein